MDLTLDYTWQRRSLSDDRLKGVCDIKVERPAYPQQNGEMPSVHRTQCKLAASLRKLSRSRSRSEHPLRGDRAEPKDDGFLGWAHSARVLPTRHLLASNPLFPPRFNEPNSRYPMKKTKLQLLIGFACATVALATASLQAQTLPVTTGLQLWLRADAGITTNASGVVTNWADQSGVGNNATSPDPTKAPTLQLNAFPNGLPALRFSGGTKYLDVASTPSLSSLGENVTMLVVVEYDNFTGFQASIAKTANGIAEPFDTWTSAGTDNGATRFYKNAGTATTYNFVTCNLSPPPVAGIYNAFAFTLTNNVFNAYIDNRPYGAGTMPGTPLDSGNPLRIGSRDNTGTQLIGGMVEVLIYQPALSAGDVLNVITNYLAPKYNLPIDAPPTVSITSPADGAMVATPGSVHVNIAAADSDGTVARVNVYANGALLGGSTASPYQLDLVCTHLGTVILTAVATDNLGLATTSAPVTVNFTGYAPATPPVSSALNVD